MFEGPKGKIAKTGPRKLLALDGGGMRGLISIEILARIEQLVREQTGNPRAVLADYFDYIAGTSTGSIIGTCLALGRTVDEVRNIYLNHGPHMFDRGTIFRRFRSLYPLKVYPYMLTNLLWGMAGRRLAWGYAEYPDTPLIETYTRPEIIGGDEVQLGSDHLRTLLMVTMANATTDSPWPVSNNPLARYNHPEHPPRPTPSSRCGSWSVRAPLRRPFFLRRKSGSARGCSSSSTAASRRTTTPLSDAG